MVYNPTTMSRPAIGAFSITPGASALAQPTRGLYVGVAGDVTVTMIEGSSVTFANLPVGLHPIAVTHVTAATATDILGLV